MEAAHPLKALLQLQLATDSSSVLHLPYTLSTLSADALLPSSHIQKWTTRVNSLLHSKDPGARWAGLCLAYKTSIYSKALMIECAQSWLGVAVPMLSKNEPTPILKAAIRLIRQIFSGATDVPEFQRQVATPNVPKFTLALVGLAGKHENQEVKLLVLDTLARIVPLYPTLHRASHNSLSALSLRFLHGSAPRPTTAAILEAASRLYAVLHFTGGKVGAANLWRKSIDDTVTFAWSALLAIRTTFPNEGRGSGISPEDPLVSVPLNLDRLRCAVIILCDLLRSTTHRPVQAPIGSLVSLSAALISCTADDQVQGHFDPAVRAMEVSVVPSIWKLSCELLACLARATQHHLTSSLPRLISYITYHLEQPLPSSQRLPFLETAQVLLTTCQPLHSSLVPTRLAKAILPSLSVVLATQSELASGSTNGTGQSKKSMKRGRGYEGDELFKMSRDVICSTDEEGSVVLAALDLLQLVMRNPHLASAVHSISSRVLLSVLLALPQISPASLSSDLSLHSRLMKKMQELAAELGMGTTSVMSKSLGLIIASGTESNQQRAFDLLLHPRVPPLVRSLPHVETLSLFRAEESNEERDAREALGLGAMYGDVVIEKQLEAMEVVDETPAPAPVVRAPGLFSAPTPAPAPVTSVAVPMVVEAKEPPFPPAPVAVAKKAVPAPAAVPTASDDEDEEMPAIDLESDSDEE